MEQWQAYPDSATASGSRRYNGTSSNQMSPRDYGNGQLQQQQQQAQIQQAQPPAGFKFEQYQGGLNPQQTSSTSPMTSPGLRDGNGDVRMQDAHDPYAGIKYPLRPHHQQQLSGALPSNIHQSQEPSSAAQRYSPMEVLSPANSYAPPPKSALASSQFSQSPAQRQSPTRQSDYGPQSPYYSSRQGSSQLPPLNQYVPGPESYQSSTVAAMDAAYMDPKSPRRIPQPAPQFDKGPVPELKKIRAPSDLRPKVNTQPAFRRANPEGGFISVSLYPPVPLPSQCSYLADHSCGSPSKPLPCIFPPPTEYAIPISSTSRRGIRAVS